MGRVRRLAVVNSVSKASLGLEAPAWLEIKLHELRYRVFARTPYDHLFTELGTVEAAERALAAGCDGLLIDTFGDYGIERIRSITDVPVIGAGEAAIGHAHETLGYYSIVTVWPPSMAYLYEERLAASPGGATCAGIHHLTGEDELERVGTDTGVKERLARRESAVADQIKQLAVEAVGRDGTTGVLLGCTCMSPIAGTLAESCGFPVIDPTQVAFDRALLALGTGTEAAYPGPQAGIRARATELVSAHLSHREIDEDLEHCDVCVLPASPGKRWTDA